MLVPSCMSSPSRQLEDVQADRRLELPPVILLRKLHCRRANYLWTAMSSRGSWVRIVYRMLAKGVRLVRWAVLPEMEILVIQLWYRADYIWLVAQDANQGFLFGT